MSSVSCSFPRLLPSLLRAGKSLLQNVTMEISPISALFPSQFLRFVALKGFMSFCASMVGSSFKEQPVLRFSRALEKGDQDCYLNNRHAQVSEHFLWYHGCFSCSWGAGHVIRFLGQLSPLGSFPAPRDGLPSWADVLQGMFSELGSPSSCTEPALTC